MPDFVMPGLFPWQTRVRKHPARFKVCALGRRAGKTRLGVALCLETALKGGIAWWVAPDYPTANVGWRFTTYLARQIPGAVEKRGDRIWEFPRGGWIQIRSAWEPDSLRSEGLNRVVIDEAALVQEPAWTQALRPALTDRLGDAVFLFSPKGRNWVYRLYLRGQDEAEPEYASWNLPSTVNPRLEPTEIQQARRDMPDRWFRQEYLAEFLDDAGGVYRNVRAAVRNRATAGPIFVGGDWAQSVDFTVLTAIQDGHVVGFDRFNGVGWDLQFGRLKAFCDRLEPALVLLESNSMGGPLVERAQRELDWPVQGFQTTAQSKRQLIDAHALAVETGEYTIPALVAEDGHFEALYPEMVNELEAFEYVTGPTGNVRFSAPSGLHDDCVMSGALAHWAQTRIGGAAGSFDPNRKPPPSIMRAAR